MESIYDKNRTCRRRRLSSENFAARTITARPSNAALAKVERGRCELLTITSIAFCFQPIYKLLTASSTLDLIFARRAYIPRSVHTGIIARYRVDLTCACARVQYGRRVKTDGKVAGGRRSKESIVGRRRGGWPIRRGRWCARARTLFAGRPDP